MSSHTFTAMGTTVSIRVADSAREALELAAAIASARQAFEEIESLFSLFRPDSELSRIARDELRIEDASARVLAAADAASQWAAQTSGAFTAHRPDGVLDLSGIVKAQAILEAADRLAGSGIAAFVVNAGGDILSVGVPSRGYWAAGIVDPQDRSRLLTTLRLDPELPALATSGSGERGEHIWRRDGGAAGQIVQASVIAGDIVTADVLATAIVAGGSAALDQVTANFPVGVLAAFDDGSLAANPMLRGRLDVRN